MVTFFSAVAHNLEWAWPQGAAETSASVPVITPPDMKIKLNNVANWSLMATEVHFQAPVFSTIEFWVWA